MVENWHLFVNYKFWGEEEIMNQSFMTPLWLHLVILGLSPLSLSPQFTLSLSPVYSVSPQFTHVFQTSIDGFLSFIHSHEADIDSIGWTSRYVLAYIPKDTLEFVELENWSLTVPRKTGMREAKSNEKEEREERERRKREIEKWKEREKSLRRWREDWLEGVSDISLIVPEGYWFFRLVHVTTSDCYSFKVPSRIKEYEKGGEGSLRG